MEIDNNFKFTFGLKPYVPEVRCPVCGTWEVTTKDTTEESLCLSCLIAYTNEMLAVVTSDDYKRFCSKWAVVVDTM